MAVRVLERSERNRVLGGVFGGLGEYLNVDPNILRLVGVVLLILAPIP
ncbi:MAG: PspC domain-containing protein, partial [Candidatus Caldarchaeum sp.]|nr:PspC domain-containing protein [Candidatus Caldarchaeum sp.]